MTLEFIYFKELEAFLQILLLGSVLSFIVCYAVENLKNTGITQKWFYFTASIIISAVFGYTFAETFTQMTMNETAMLCICLWLGSQGFYEHLKQSDSWLGKAFVSLSEMKEVPKGEPKEEVKVEAPKEEVKAETPKEEVIEPTVPDDEETDEVLPEVPKAEKRNVKSNQIKVLVNDLRIRATPNGTILGYAEKNKYYTYSETEVKDGVKWYKVGDCYMGDAGSGDIAVCNASDYMIFPLKQYVWVSTKFSKEHPAVDFGWSRNYGGSSQTLVAPYKMTVAKTGYDSTIGNYIYAHTTYEGKKYTFRFIHMSTVSVSQGQTVEKGAVIGKMGNTGSSSNGAHLHFDILDGHRTSLPSDRYNNSYDAMKMCYATSSVVVDSDTLKEFSVLKV